MDLSPIFSRLQRAADKGEHDAVQVAVDDLLDALEDMAEYDPYSTYSSAPAGVIVGLNVRRYREENGLTLSALGAMVGLSADVVRNVESSRRKLDLDELVAMAGALMVPVVALLAAPFDGESPVESPVDVVESPLLGEVDGKVWNEMLVGRDGNVGTGGPRWRAARTVRRSIRTDGE